MQSVPITTDVKSNLHQGEVYNIMFLFCLFVHDHDGPSGKINNLSINHANASILSHVSISGADPGRGAPLKLEKIKKIGVKS
jgi:hypothetical protein